MEKISFKTDDGVTIAGNFWSSGSEAVLLLHMMPAAKESWNSFANTLHKNGFSVLAIDLRGHGESTVQDGKVLDYRSFSDSEHQASLHDIESAVTFLKSKGPSKIHIGGASIGANFALQYQSEHPEVEKTVLLSPGLNYRGIETESLASRLRESQKIFILVGTKDRSLGNPANEIAEVLSSANKGETQVKIYESAAHGTNLFGEDPNLASELVAWLKA